MTEINDKALESALAFLNQITDDNGYLIEEKKEKATEKAKFLGELHKAIVA